MTVKSLRNHTVTGRACTQHRIQRALIIGALALAAFLCSCSRGPDPEYYIRELHSPDSKTRERAVAELTRMREDALPAVKELLKVSSDTPSGVLKLRGAIEVLSRNRSEESLQAIATKIEDPNAEVRLAAIEGVSKLAEVRKGKSLALLKQTMKDTDSKCVRAAATGLMKLNYPEATAALEEYMSYGGGLQSIFAAEAIYLLYKRPQTAQVILEELSSRDKDAKAAARGIVVGLADMFVQPLVQYAAQHPEVQEVEAALSDVREELFKELRKMLTPRRVRQVTTALGKIADKQSADGLLRLAGSTDHDASTRIAAIAALGEAATSRRPASVQPDLRASLVDGLKTLLDRTHEDNRIRIACAISLCRFREKQGIEYLLQQLESLEKQAANTKTPPGPETEALTELRVWAQEAITSSGEFVVPYLLDILKRPDAGGVTSWAAAKTLGELRVEEAVPYLGALLTASGGPEALQQRQGDPYEKISFDTRSGPFEVSITREIILRAAFTDLGMLPKPSAYVRIAAAEALGRIGARTAVEKLREGLVLPERTLSVLRPFVEQRAFSRLIPAGATNEKQRRKAIVLLGELSRRILREQEAVQFYIRLALEQLGEQA